MSYGGIALKTGTDYGKYDGTLGENYVNAADDVADAYRIWDSGKLPFIHFMFHLNRQPGCSIYEIANGTYTDLTIHWFQSLVAYCNTGRKAVVVFCPEMNGNWVPAYATDDYSTVAFIEAYRDFVALGTEMGLDASKVKWCWAPNNKGWENLRDWYPGDEWVDIVGMSAYNWGGIFHDRWLTPAELLDPTVAEVRGFTENPLFVTQIASGLNDSRTPEWLDQLVAYAGTGVIGGFVWFNIDMFELGAGTDWNAQVGSLDRVRPDYWFFDC